MLVNCVVYQEGKKLADIAQSEIHDYLAKPGAFVWVALRDTTDVELEEMSRQFDLHELAVEDARHGHQRPKIEEYGSEIFTVLHVVEVAGDELHVGEVNVFTGPNFVLSIRNRTEQGFLGVRARCEREPELLAHGSGYVLYALMDAVVDRYFPVLDAIETELEAIEERIFANTSPRANIEALYYVKQKVTTLKHAAGPLMDSVGKLYGGRVPAICTYTQEYFRDVSDHLQRLDQTIESIRDTIATAMPAVSTRPTRSIVSARIVAAHCRSKARELGSASSASATASGSTWCAGAACACDRECGDGRPDRRSHAARPARGAVGAGPAARHPGHQQHGGEGIRGVRLHARGGGSVPHDVGGPRDQPAGHHCRQETDRVGRQGVVRR